jgi:GAF domain-containing protein
VVSPEGRAAAASTRPGTPPHPVELAGLLHELTAQLLASPDVHDSLERIAGLAAGALPEAVRCSVVLIGDGTPTVTAARGEQACELDGLQHATGQGPALDALRTRSVVTCRDLTTDPRWPAIGDCARRSGVGAVASVPMDVRRNAVGALTVFVARPDGVDAHVMITAMALAGQAEILLGEVLRRQSEAEAAGQLVATRLAGATVDQAVGVIVAQRGCGVDEAYEILRETSERLHTHPQDVAERLVRAAVRHAE